MRWWIIGWWLVFTGSVWAEPPVRMILITGQSNSLGTTADPAAFDAGPGSAIEDERVPFFWSNRSTRGGDDAAALIGDSGGKYTALQAQQGEGRNKTFWGPEIYCGRHLCRAGWGDFVLVKASRGGGGNGHWLAEGEMYQHVVQTVSQARKRLLEEGRSVEISHLLYVQGESDSEQEAAVSGARVVSLLDRLKEEWPEAGEMKLIIGGIAAEGKRRDRVRRHQAAVADRRADIRYIDNLDLQPNLYDGLHFDRAAKQMLGFRFAQAIWSETASLTRVACVGDSITFGAGIRARATGKYPAQLQLLLGVDWAVREFGSSGRGSCAAVAKR